MDNVVSFLVVQRHWNKLDMGLRIESFCLGLGLNTFGEIHYSDVLFYDSFISKYSLENVCCLPGHSLIFFNDAADNSLFYPMNPPTLDCNEIFFINFASCRFVYSHQRDIC